MFAVKFCSAVISELFLCYELRYFCCSPLLVVYLSTRLVFDSYFKIFLTGASDFGLSRPLGGDAKVLMLGERTLRSLAIFALRYVEKEGVSTIKEVQIFRQRGQDISHFMFSSIDFRYIVLWIVAWGLCSAIC
jgi:hypothetical protein